MWGETNSKQAFGLPKKEIKASSLQDHSHTKQSS
jgi:hypothetical protein